MDFRQRKGGGYNTDSTYLSQSFISITYYGLSSTQRWRLQYRLNIQFTVVYFHHVLWTFVNAKVEATIPTQHTSHGRLFSSHSMVLRRHRGGGYNTDSTHFSRPFIFITFHGFTSTHRWRLQYRLNTPFSAIYFRHVLSLFNFCQLSMLTHMTSQSEHWWFFHRQNTSQRRYGLLYKRHKGIKHKWTSILQPLSHGTIPTKRTHLFLIYLHYNMTLNIATCFGPQRDFHQGTTPK